METVNLALTGDNGNVLRAELFAIFCSFTTWAKCLLCGNPAGLGEGKTRRCYSSLLPDHSLVQGLEVVSLFIPKDPTSFLLALHQPNC